ncbi:UNVERIFIED_ORG: hypothetical protein [Salmonella phage PSP2-22]
MPVVYQAHINVNFSIVLYYTRATRVEEPEDNHRIPSL